MINTIKTYFSERAQRKKYERSLAYFEKRAKQRKELDAIVAENVELRMICINNVRYINSYIKVLSANVNHAKGTNAAATNRKRKSMRERIEWLKSKLIEEESMVNYYDTFIPI